MFAQDQDHDQAKEFQDGDPNEFIFQKNARTALTQATQLNDNLPYAELNHSLQKLQEALNKVHKAMPDPTPSERTRYIQQMALSPVTIHQWTSDLLDMGQFVKELSLGSDNPDPDDNYNADTSKATNPHIQLFLKINQITPIRLQAPASLNYERVQAQMHHEMLRQRAFEKGKVSWINSSKTVPTVLRAGTTMIATLAISLTGQLLVVDADSPLTALANQSQTLTVLRSAVQANPILLSFLTHRMHSVAVDIVAVGGILLNAPGKPTLETLKQLKSIGVKYVSILLPLFILTNPAFALAGVPALGMEIILRGTINISIGALDKGLDFVLDKVFLYEPTGDDLMVLKMQQESQRLAQQNLDWEKFLTEAKAITPTTAPAFAGTKACFRRIVGWIRERVPWSSIVKYTGLAAVGVTMALAVAYVFDCSMLDILEVFGGQVVRLTSFVTDSAVGQDAIRQMLLPYLDSFLIGTLIPWLVNFLGNLFQTVTLAIARASGVARVLAAGNRKLEQMVSQWTGRTIVWEHTMTEISYFCYQQYVAAAGTVLGKYGRSKNFIRLYQTGSLSHAARGAYAILNHNPLRTPVDYMKLMDMRYMMPAMVVQAEGVQVGDFLFEHLKPITPAAPAPTTPTPAGSAPAGPAPTPTPTPTPALYRVLSENRYQELATGTVLSHQTFMLRPGVAELYVDLSLRDTIPLGDLPTPFNPAARLINIHTGARVQHAALPQNANLNDYAQAKDDYYIHNQPLRVPVFYLQTIVDEFNFTPEQSTTLATILEQHPELTAQIQGLLQQNRIAAQHLEQAAQELKNEGRRIDENEAVMKGQAINYAMPYTYSGEKKQPGVIAAYFQMPTAQLGTIDPNFATLKDKSIYQDLQQARAMDQEWNYVKDEGVITDPSVPHGRLIQGLLDKRRFVAVTSPEYVAQQQAQKAHDAANEADQNIYFAGRQNAGGLRAAEEAMARIEKREEKWKAAAIKKEADFQAAVKKGRNTPLAQAGLVEDYRQGIKARRAFVATYKKAVKAFMGEARERAQENYDTFKAVRESTQTTIQNRMDSILVAIEKYKTDATTVDALGTPVFAMPVVAPINFKAIENSKMAFQRNMPTQNFQQQERQRQSENINQQSGSGQQKQQQQQQQTKVDPMTRFLENQVQENQATQLAAFYQENKTAMMVNAYELGQAQDLTFLLTIAGFLNTNTASTKELDRLAQLSNRFLDQKDKLSLDQKRLSQDSVRCQLIITNAKLGKLGVLVYADKPDDLELTEMDKKCFSQTMVSRLVDLLFGTGTGVAEAVITAALWWFGFGWAGKFLATIGLNGIAICLMQALTKMGERCEEAVNCSEETNQNAGACKTTPSCVYTAPSTPGDTGDPDEPESRPCHPMYGRFSCNMAIFTKSLLCSSEVFRTLTFGIGGCGPKRDSYFTSEEIVQELQAIAADQMDEELVQKVMDIRKSPVPNNLADLKKYASLFWSLLTNNTTRNVVIVFIAGKKYSAIRPEWDAAEAQMKKEWSMVFYMTRFAHELGNEFCWAIGNMIKLLGFFWPDEHTWERWAPDWETPGKYGEKAVKLAEKTATAAKLAGDGIKNLWNWVKRA